MLTNRKTFKYLLLGPDDHKDLVSMADAIDLVEHGYREASDDPLVNAPRRRIHSPDGVRTSNFPGAVHGLGVIGSMTRTETVTHTADGQTCPYRGHPVHVLNDSHNGHLLCVMLGEAVEKTIGFSSAMALRTAATSGIGFRYLARKDSRTAGVFGAGGMSLHHLIAMKNERPIEHVKVYSRQEENRRKFAAEASRRLGIDVVPVGSPEDVIRGVDIVLCATNTNVPVFDGNLLEPGQHLTTIIGSNAALVKGGWLSSPRREIDDNAVRKADVIVANWKESVLQEEQADLYEPIQKGIITIDDIHDLGELPSGHFAGRTSDDQITLHKNNNGTGVADLAIAMHIYNQAKALGRGTWIEVPEAGE